MNFGGIHPRWVVEIWFERRSPETPASHCPLRDSELLFPPPLKGGGSWQDHLPQGATSQPHSGSDLVGPGDGENFGLRVADLNSPREGSSSLGYINGVHLCGHRAGRYVSGNDFFRIG